MTILTRLMRWALVALLLFVWAWFWVLAFGGARAQDLPLGARAVAAGAPAPFAGVVIRVETLLALLEAQDQRDKLIDLRRQDAEQRAIDAERADADIEECQAVSDARERQRAACEASRVPPAPRCECAWGGWPIVSGVAGAAVGFGVGWAVTR